MLIHLALVMEISAVLICIYCVYGKKIKLDIPLVVLFMVILIWLELINYLHLSGINSLWIYPMIFGFCKYNFKESVFQTIVSIILSIVITGVAQFICMLSVQILFDESEIMRTTIGNVIVLCGFIWILPKCGIEKLRLGFRKKNISNILIWGFVFVVILIMLMQNKILLKIHIGYFFFSIPAVAMLLFVIKRWNVTENVLEQTEKEIRLNKEAQGKYETLLTNMRIKQHEFKNHVAALLSAHYTNKTYEKLVKAQEEYCNCIWKDNKYSSLLWLGDNVLAGFLYGKFQEAETDGVKIQYRITAEMKNYEVPTYHLVEMVGILFDNAIEATKYKNEKIIVLSFTEEEDVYKVNFRNKCEYVPYSEIEQWFQLEKSSKGTGRGLGLFHVKQLCEEWNCSIICRNLVIDAENWIEFSLEFGKKRAAE